MALLYRSLPVSSHSQLPRQPYPPRRTPSRTLAVRAVAREQGENWALGRGCGLLATATAMTIALPLILVPLPAQAIQPVRGVPTVQPAFPQHRGAQHALLSLDGRPACSVLCCLQHRRQEWVWATWFETLPGGRANVPTARSHYNSLSTSTNSSSRDRASSDHSGD